LAIWFLVSISLLRVAARRTTGNTKGHGLRLGVWGNTLLSRTAFLRKCIFRGSIFMGMSDMVLPVSMRIAISGSECHEELRHAYSEKDDPH
jgi:hypothetical protein